MTPKEALQTILATLQNDKLQLSNSTGMKVACMHQILSNQRKEIPADIAHKLHIKYGILIDSAHTYIRSNNVA